MLQVPAAWRQFPWGVIALLCFIGGFSLLVLYSAAGGSWRPWTLPQGIRFVATLTMAVCLSYVPARLIERLSYPAFLGVLLLLLLVEITGALRGGSQRWLNLGVINLQPSELMKVAVVLACARFYAQLPPGLTRRWSALWPALLLTLMPMALVLVQPDLGTALAIGVAGVTVMFLAGLPLWWFVGAGSAALAMLPVAYLLMQDYQQRRVMTFLDPDSNPLGAGYHITQSKIAIGSGGIFGKGFLNGSQGHLGYLPEGQTDFVFSTMAEEWGLVGAIALIGAFLLLLRWGLRIAQRAPHRFGQLTAAGLVMVIFFFVAVNLMMVVGFAPVVGIPLPLFSYGGSSMLTIMLCIGILLAIDRDRERGPRRF